jgi:hypothetical protein
MYSLKGIVKVLGDVQQISPTFKKREIVLTDNSSQYPQHVSFQLTQDKVDLANGVNVGEEVTVNFNLRGREWTSPKDGQVRYFNSLDIWKLEQESASMAPPANQAPPVTEESFMDAGESDDLPF